MVIDYEIITDTVACELGSGNAYAQAMVKRQKERKYTGYEGPQ